MQPIEHIFAVNYKLQKVNFSMNETKTFSCEIKYEKLIHRPLGENIPKFNLTKENK